MEVVVPLGSTAETTEDYMDESIDFKCGMWVSYITCFNKLYDVYIHAKPLQWKSSQNMSKD